MSRHQENGTESHITGRIITKEIVVIAKLPRRSRKGIVVGTLYLVIFGLVVAAAWAGAR